MREENKKKKTNEYQTEGPEMHETVVQIKRTSKKTKGGDRLGFTCLSVVGDRMGQVGVALSKAPVVVAAVKKAHRKARDQMMEVPVLGEARTIPHRIEVRRGASHVLLKPAPAGTGVRAGGAVRSILEAAGIQNVVAKILGTDSVKGNVDATMKALRMLKDPKTRITLSSKDKAKKTKAKKTAKKSSKK